MNPQQREFDSLVQSYYEAWFRFHPERAVDAGVSGYEHLLPPCGDDEIGALIGLNEKLLAALDELGEDGLEPDRRIDFQLLQGAALIEHHELLERDWRRRDPLRYLPTQAIYQLTVRSVPNLRDALLGRLSQIPAHLRAARAQLSTMPELVPPLWLEEAIDEARQGAVYLRDLHKHPKVSHAFPSTAGLHERQEEAAHALEDYAHFLESDLAPQAEGDYACGQDHFQRLLRYRHFLDVSAAELHAFGRDLFEATRQELAEAAKAIDPSADLAAVTAGIQRDHPAADELLDTYRGAMQAARRFVKERELVSLPAVEELRVVETPAFMRPEIPFAAYMEPALGDEHQRGYYYVTPANDPELLKEHNRSGLLLTSVHEAWPGHHLQFVTANLNPVARSLPRLLNPSATLYEGWALYCEQLMVEEGFLSRPEHRFVMLRDRLWRALRVMLDVELHTRGLGVDEASMMMEESLGFAHSQAIGELTWYTHEPTVPLGYATGWAVINAARDSWCRTRPGTPLKAFHDRLLAAGSMAASLGISRSFGAEVWDTVKSTVFAAST